MDPVTALGVATTDLIQLRKDFLLEKMHSQ